MGTLLVAFVALLAATQLLGWVAERLGHPRVVGELLAGVALGTLGLTAGHALTVVGEAALAVYVFRVVAGLDLPALRAERGPVVRVAVGSFAVPFLAGAGAAFALGRTEPAAVLFLATAFAVTAFPVLARIVEDRGLAETRAGRVALGAAAAQEVLVWPLVGIAVALASGASPSATAVRGAAALALAVLVARRGGGLLGLAVAATATQLAGLHVVLGAFVYALALPSERRARIVARLDSPAPRRTTAVLLPLFFAVPALRVDLGGLRPGLLLAVLAVAVGAKFGSAALAARLPVREALIVGALMNTRGLVELIVLSAGLEAGLVDVHLYTAMVAMALITTLAAGPVLTRLSRTRGTPKVRALCVRTASS